MKRTLQIIALFVFACVPVLAQQSVDPKAVAEKYDEISRLEDITARHKIFATVSDEMRVALWKENIKRKTADLTLTSEQKAVIEEIDTKFNTVEFLRENKEKSEKEAAGGTFNEALARANALLGKELMNDLFGVLGDRKTLKD